MRDKDKALVVVFCDANAEIGSGHAVRCRAIAGALEDLGVRVTFAVADERSVAFLGPWGKDAEILGGDCRALGREDGRMLGNLCCTYGAQSLLVDSYGASGTFFSALRGAAPNLRVAYIDDLYNFALGRLDRPRRWDADAVVAYGFGLENSGFDRVYAGTDTKPLIGPRYAPLRPGFANSPGLLAGVRYAPARVRRIMVTTGSTNPNGMLEAMVSAALAVVPDAEVEVIVGALSDFNLSVQKRMHVHRGLTDLSSLMHDADLVVSAAGTTLYELCAVGAPTVAVPIVANQLPNADGFEAAGLGLIVRPDACLGTNLAAADTGTTVCDSHSFTSFEARLTAVIRSLASDASARACLSSRMRATVDGKGSIRIARLLTWV